MSDTSLEKNGGAGHARGPGTWGYIAVWLGLVIFTAVTVTMASLDLGRIAIAVVLAIAATKSVLVLLYFMHLRYEGKLVIKLLLPIVIITLSIFIGLTYTDILYR